MSTLVFDLDAASAAVDLPADTLDPLLDGAAGGALWDVDLQVGGYSYPSTLDPANGAVIADLSEASALNGAVTLGGTGAITRAGNGFDFSNVVNPGHRIEGPASVSTSIWGGGTKSQYFFFMVYVRLPTKAQWPATGTYSRPVPILTFATASGGFTAEPDLLSINYLNNGASLRFVRPTNGTTSFEIFDLTPDDNDYGQVVQLCYWRDASGQIARLRSPRGTITLTRVVGTDNPADFSGKKPQLGCGNATWNNASTAGKTMRIYRAYMENLQVSGRSAVRLADRDYESVFGVRGLPFS